MTFYENPFQNSRVQTEPVIFQDSLEPIVFHDSHELIIFFDKDERIVFHDSHEPIVFHYNHKPIIQHNNHEPIVLPDATFLLIFYRMVFRLCLQVIIWLSLETVNNTISAPQLQRWRNTCESLSLMSWVKLNIIIHIFFNYHLLNFQRFTKVVII